MDSKAGGAERRFFRLISYLHANKYDVHLFTSEEGVVALESLGISLDGERIHVLPGASESTSRLNRYSVLMRRMTELVKRIRRNNILHLHFGQNPGADSFAYALISKFACSFSVSLVDSIDDYQQTMRKKLFTVVTARYCTYVDCLSQQIKDNLCSLLGRKYERKILVSPCSFTDLKAVTSAKVRDIDIALIARMIPLKGHELLANSLLDLESANRTGLVVYVCGSGPLESSIRRCFDSIKRQEIHINYVQNPFEILARTKIFVSLQEIENYPSQSLLEAMICKCAVIATDVGSTRQLLDESCAILIPSDPAALAAVVQKLLDNESLRDRLGREAARKVASTQTIERFSRYFLIEVFGMNFLRANDELVLRS